MAPRDGPAQRLLRSGRSRAPPDRRASRSPRRSRMACGVRTRTRAAASSMASGRPSSRTQISATAGVRVVDREVRRTATARSTNRATDSNWVNCSRSGRWRVGQAEWRDRVLPLAVDPEWAAAGGQDRRLRGGASRSRPAARRLRSVRSCRGPGRRGRRSDQPFAAGGRPRVGIPAAWATVGMNRSGLAMGSRATKYTPAGNRSAASAATWSASRSCPCRPARSG